MKFGRIFPQVSTQPLTSYFQDGGHDYISRKSLKLLYLKLAKTRFGRTSSEYASIDGVGFF